MSADSFTSVVIKKEPTEESANEEDHLEKWEQKIFVTEHSVKVEPLDFNQSSSLDSVDQASSLLPPTEQSWPFVKIEKMEIKEQLSLTSIVKPETAFVLKTEDNTSMESTDIQPDISYTYTSQDDSSLIIPLGDERTSCPICQKRFANPGNVQRHMLIHSRTKCQCPECNREFLQESQLAKHMSKHGVVRIFACNDCGKQFVSNSKLKQHLRVHLIVKPFFCNVCHRTFATEQYLLKHQGKSRCKRPIDQPVTCPVCSASFAKEFQLKRHSKKHDTAKPYSCDTCGVSFKYKSTIIKHVQWHSGMKPYLCKICNKSFSNHSLLKPHMRVHTGEKPFQCVICQKMFSHKHNMQRHTLRHAKEKNLTCKVCCKKFPRESRLIYHMRIHVNDKGFFPCNICTKRFSHKQNVLRHYARKHPGHTYYNTDTDAKVAVRVWDTVRNQINCEPDEEPEEILSL